MIEIIQVICFIYLGIRLNAPVWYYILLGYAALDSVEHFIEEFFDGLLWKTICEIKRRGK